MVVDHTYIEFFGWVLADPLTFLSDILMGAFCAFYGYRLYYNFKSKYAKFTALFFLLLAVSSFLGGFAHLLDEYIGNEPHLIAWSIQGISVLLFQMASLSLLRSTKSKFVLRGLIYASFVFFIFRVFSVQHFDVVKFNSTVGLVGIVSLIHVYKYLQDREIVYLRIPLAIIIFAGPALIHSFGLSYNTWIDYNVISHVLLLPCYYLLYKVIGQVVVTKKKTKAVVEAVPLKVK